MDILIKGMEMPVDHGIFLVICPNGTIEQNVGTADNGYPIYHIVKEAKAVALPPHGDLIDRDELKIDDSWALVGTGTIWDAPVIVEATE